MSKDKNIWGGRIWIQCNKQLWLVVALDLAPQFSDRNCPAGQESGSRPDTYPSFLPNWSQIEEHRQQKENTLLGKRTLLLSSSVLPIILQSASSQRRERFLVSQPWFFFSETVSSHPEGDDENVKSKEYFIVCTMACAHARLYLGCLTSRGNLATLILENGLLVP